MPLTTYHDTRALDPTPRTFTDVVIKGIAEGGGLYVPEWLPELELATILGLAALPYHARAFEVFRRLGIDVPEARQAELLAEAYGANFDNPAVAPVVAGGDAAPGMHVLELWHGPTSAFKDMALQCMPLFFSEAVAMRRAAGADVPDFLVLVATSGDTGKAALEGFADRENTRIAVLYPAGGVSEIQRRQMVTQHGANVAVFGVEGNFDDCQNAVKAAFADPDFNALLRRDHHTELSSANSINWGRLLPQIVYYVSAYADVVASGALEPGAPLDVCVPTGNFGNILAALYAKRMGVPLGRLLCASNENDVLADFIATGTYDIRERPFVTTPSPSMDILISSNLERALFELCGDPERIRGWMTELTLNKSFTVDPDTRAAIQDLFLGDSVDNDESLAVIRRVLADTGRLLDPHTAVAWAVAERHKGVAPVLVVSTAHWAKFAADVYKALRAVPYGAPLPPDAAGLTEFQLLEEVLRMAPDETIPAGLAELVDAPVRFNTVIARGREAVEGAVLEWLTEG
ncbi:MAG: threonine synthase [Actinobacteria bacterium]|nr:threonine synthase [Actinomycetota bacterium]